MIKNLLLVVCAFKRKLWTLPQVTIRGVGRDATKLSTGRLSTRTNPLSYFCFFNFYRRGTSIAYLLLKRGTSFTYLVKFLNPWTEVNEKFCFGRTSSTTRIDVNQKFYLVLVVATPKRQIFLSFEILYIPGPRKRNPFQTKPPRIRHYKEYPRVSILHTRPSL